MRHARNDGDAQVGDFDCGDFSAGSAATDVGDKVVVRNNALKGLIGYGDYRA